MEGDTPQIPPADPSIGRGGENLEDRPAEAKNKIRDKERESRDGIRDDPI
jgi:hypothetical protein